jgi:hypothetical protein
MIKAEAWCYKDILRHKGKYKKHFEWTHSDKDQKDFIETMFIKRVAEGNFQEGWVVYDTEVKE